MTQDSLLRLQWLRKLFLEKERRLQAFYNLEPSDKTGENGENGTIITIPTLLSSELRNIISLTIYGSIRWYWMAACDQAQRPSGRVDSSATFSAAADSDAVHDYRHAAESGLLRCRYAVSGSARRGRSCPRRNG